MATVKTQPVGNQGVNLSLLDIRALAAYDHWQLTPSSIKLHDASGANYALFSGSNFSFKTNGNTIEDVLSGTVTKLDIGLGGVDQIAFSNLNLSAKTFFDYFMAADTKGAWDYLFSGNDSIVGTQYADYLFGGAGNDTISGGTGNDAIEGNAGNDKLYGGKGADTLAGGTGADTFVFKSTSDSTVSASGRDTLSDFSRAQKDQISLSAIDANTKIAGNQAFSFIGTDKFHSVAGELRYEKVSGDTLIHGDVNGDGKADFSLLVDAAIDFSVGDFIL
ncbi:hypothetical protein [Sinorhizobium sp. RAC02]|uniref:hypothetical protein n=1 Tax=Sinorhizobium sp. RAC02 TaxID=1842534 RepID=UPI00083E2A5A|nr:hypothetical protein [Sinorhizobium sp. RAC02]AOF92129.1 hemolysin-type calcium-binding repeat family protein [Sinorhizobium sp. RAC02]